MHRHRSDDDAFIVTAPTYKILNQSTLPAFKKYNEGIGRYFESKAEFKIMGGGKVYFRTGKEPDSVVGITNVRAILCDEGGKYTRYFWDNIQARAAFKNAPVFIATSPYATNWLYKDIVKPAFDGKRPDVKYINAKSIENPYFPREVYDIREKTMDPRRFMAIYGGDFGKKVGLVYDCFDEDENTCEPFELPVGTKFFGGIDWGYTDPFVFTIRAITPEGNHFQISELVHTRLTMSDIVSAVKQITAACPVEMIYCDPSQPASIMELNKARIPSVAADNDIRLGIDVLYEQIKARKFKLFKGGSPHTIDELEQYHYPEPEDLGPDQDSKEAVPVDQYNHCLDAVRYLSISTRSVFTRTSPKLPQDHKKTLTLSEKLERLKRLKHSSSESWS